MSPTQSTTTPATKPVMASIPYYSGPFNPPDTISAVSTKRYCDWRSVNINDVRSSTKDFTLDKNGFQYMKHSSALSSPPHTLASWKDNETRKRVNDAEILELGKAVTGAKKVLVVLAIGRDAAFTDPLDQTSRPDVYGNQTDTLPATRQLGFYGGANIGPARKPHVDWGPDGVRSILRNWSHELADEAKDIIDAEDEAISLPGGIEENYKGRRWGLYNTWRPLKPVRRDPLACVDFVSSKNDKSAILLRKIPGIHGPCTVDALFTPANPKHEWYWMSDQQPDDILFMKIFDSAHERDPKTIAGGVHHCSFHHPGTEDEEVRESLETKFMAFW
ncbi:ga4 desaturase [Fusarium avenaceum]|nr:ga4 desaturase [Fusarium avenaceum]